MQQSYEDKDYEDAPKPVLVPVEVKRRRKPKPMLMFGEDMPEDFANKRNMVMPDDTLEEGIFGDEVEEEFDQDWIKEMMNAPGEGEEDEELEELSDCEYPKHTERRALERNFDKMMEDFDDDEDLDADDPRAQGALPATDYAPAMEEFVREQAGELVLDPTQPARHKALLGQLRQLADKNRVFDSNTGGRFLTVLPSKDARAESDLLDTKDGMKALTLALMEQGALDQDGHYDDAALRRLALGKKPKKAGEEGSSDEDDDELPNGGLGGRRVLISDKRDRVDCETVLSTYSNLYNHPNVLSAGTKKLTRPSRAEAAATAKLAGKPGSAAADANGVEDPDAAPADDIVLAQQRARKAAKDAPVANAPGVLTLNKAGLAAVQGEFADGLEGSDAGEEEEEEIDIKALSHRPKDEDPEMKKMRRALVKQHQRERRADKKAVRTAYKEAAIVRSGKAPKQAQDKATISLSVVRGKATA